MKTNMKRIKQFLTPVLFVFLIGQVSQKSVAQTALPSAQINNAHDIVLNTSAPLSNTYQASFASLNLTTEEAAKAYFDKITDNLLDYEVNFATQTVTIHTHLERAQPGWTILNWNHYIHTKLTQ